MNRRRTLIIALGTSALAPIVSIAQTQDKVWRIGFLGTRPRPTKLNPDYYDAFTQGMRELGYVEGKHFVVEWRFADNKYERLPELTMELVRMKVDVIVTHSTPGALAARQATSTIPIVVAAMTDPVAAGFASNLARPGGNLTGLSLIALELTPKHIELLKAMVPKLSRAAFLLNADNPAHPSILKSMQVAAQRIGVKILPVAARSPEEIERGFATMTRDRVEAVVIQSDALFTTRRKQIANLAIKAGLPSMTSNPEIAEAGGLMAYGQERREFFRRAASYVDKIIKGANPGELPVEQPTRLSLVINRQTAKVLGIKIPQSILVRADRVIE